MAAVTSEEIRSVIAAAAPLGPGPLSDKPGHTKYTGGCHCGAVRFEVLVAQSEHSLLDCNCSMCTKKSFLHLIASPAHFSLLQGQDALTLYTFNTHRAKHLFCKHCGISSFYRPRSHPEDFSVNAQALDNWRTIKAAFIIRPYDGANWEAARAELAEVEAQMPPAQPAQTQL